MLGSILLLIILLVLMCIMLCSLLMLVLVVWCMVVEVEVIVCVCGSSLCVILVGVSFCGEWVNSVMLSCCFSVWMCWFRLGWVMFSVWVVVDRLFLCIMVRKEWCRF